MNPLLQVPPIGPAFEKELLKDAKTYVYKKTDEGELLIHLFLPENHQPSDQRSCFLFFHGGLWDKPMITQFVPQSMHFVSRGAVAAVVEYRLANTHRTTPIESILDAQSAILWLRINHSYLGIAPQQIVVGGSGSGAHIALCAAMHKEIERNNLYDARPNALILFSAIIDTSKKAAEFDRFPTAKMAKQTSPTRHIKRKLPPAIFFHGRADATSPINEIEKFCHKYRRKKNHCVYVPYGHATHSFFNFNVSKENYVHTIESADGFITDLGFLQPDENHYIDPI